MKRLITAIIGLGAAVGAMASPLTPAQALERFQQTPARRALAGAERLQLSHTVAAPDGQAAIYVFTPDAGQGFYLLSADNAAAPLIGYSYDSEFSSEIPALQWMLEGYAAQIGEARNLPAYVSAGSRAGETPVAPMLQTRWDQNSPYNYYCPRSGAMRCPTGCVATAMAQVMKYWEYPASGYGSIEYLSHGVNETLSLNFEEVVFDWENMIEQYSVTGYTSTQAQAVGALMRACGYAVKTDYARDSSGAYSTDIPGAMQKYFGYDSGVTLKNRSSYSSAVWERMMYNELVNYGPIIYGGVTPSGGGHSFVLDGYEDGYFHVNWGWSGTGNGFFLLDDMNPGVQGTGGSTGGFTNNQQAVTGLIPKVGDLLLVGNLVIANAEASENDEMFRIDDFSNIQLEAEVEVVDGRISSPLYVQIYVYDPNTGGLNSTGFETTFPEMVTGVDGYSARLTANIDFSDYDAGKTYFLTVSYAPKSGERRQLGSLYFAAGSGVDGIEADNLPAPKYYNLQGLEVANPGKGVYIKVTGSKTEKVIR